MDGSAAIINHPEVAMLGLGRIIERPWVVDGQLAVRQVTRRCYLFDGIAWLCIRRFDYP